MRTQLGRVAAILGFAVSGVIGAVAGAGAVVASTPPSAPPSSPPAESAPTAAAPDSSDPTTTTTTTTVPPLVAESPAAVTPSRGTQAQVTDTLPPPPTTTVVPWGQLPENSGSGRRVVYSKTQQRVWIVEGSGAVSKTHLVSGRRTWNQPLPGTYSVFSRSSFTCNIKNPSICWRYMVRFTKGPEGDNIGFHEIPKKDGVPVQSESQLGSPLSGGCVRQATSDAVYMWNWAGIGTKVVVLA